MQPPLVNRRIMKLAKAAPFLLSAIIVSAGAAKGDTINFENYSGPTEYVDTGNATTLDISTPIGTVTISGGVILTDATNLPADETTVYGTDNGVVAVGGTGFTNPITITLPQPITNFYLDVLNGNTETVDYDVADNEGNSATFALAENLAGGEKTIGFAATGTTVTVTATSGTGWDFFIDNLNFDTTLPPGLNPISTTTGSPGPVSSVPEPATLLLSVVSLAGLMLLRGLERA
jgi:hypothetical protein